MQVILFTHLLKLMKTQGKVIIIEGPPGCGKTTFCRSFVQHNSNAVMLEEWVDHVVLADYIADMENKATGFQFRAQRETLAKICQAIELAKTGKTVLLDRGLVGNRCFAEVQYEAGYISSEDMEKYRREFDASRVLAEKSDGVEIITCYLKCSAEV